MNVPKTGATKFVATANLTVQLLKIVTADRPLAPTPIYEVLPACVSDNQNEQLSKQLYVPELA
jgi:hypothetical protein